LFGVAADIDPYETAVTPVSVASFSVHLFRRIIRRKRLSGDEVARDRNGFSFVIRSAVHWPQ